MLNSAEVKRQAAAAGFDACGIARAGALTPEEYPLHEWLARGWHAGLDYMARREAMRMDPRLLVEGAQTVICLVSAYGPPEAGRTDGVAAYAQRREYHRTLKPLLLDLRNRLGLPDAKPCCDTVPISDKHWAARAGLGWIGRHTLLVTPQWGTWVNLAELVTTEPCDSYDTPLPHRHPCHACHRCIDACPNQALAPDGPPMLDARRCTAYYTTHRPQPLPDGLDARGYTHGCDICQLACPFNHEDTH